MQKKKQKYDEKKMLAQIVQIAQEKKAKHIVSMDLKKVMGSSFDYFVVCHAPSTTQVCAIADAVEDGLRENFGLKPWHSEGYQNAEWVLVDYGGIVLHVFIEEMRWHYALEDLWGDAKISHYQEED